MESVFVGESLIDINQVTNNGSLFGKLKIGEIFQLRDNSLSMCCVHCLQEFQYFTEFSLHIQDHYLSGEIAQLKEIKEEIPTEIDREDLTQTNIIIESDVKCEVNEGEVDDIFNDDSMLNYYSDGDDDTLAELKEDLTENTTETSAETKSIVEGTDYEKVNNKFKCLTCDYRISKWKNLKNHLQIHSNAKDVVCPICSKLFGAVQYVRKHVHRTHNINITTEEIRRAQPTSKPVAIDVPQSESESKSKSKSEQRTYTDGIEYRSIDNKFQCLTCNRIMMKFDHMKEHLLTHTSEKNVLCPFCAQAFITESYVRKHVNRTHKMKITANDIKAAQSSINVSQIKREWAIKRDKRIVKSNFASMADEGAIRCLLCEKGFTKPRYAQKHMRLIHAKSVTINEVMSGQPSVADGHDDDYDESNEESKPSENELGNKTELIKKPIGPNVFELVKKNFECFECHKKFVSANSVRIHMKLHSGIKFTCPYCNKLFAMKSYVRDHITIMHGIKRDDIPKEIIRQASGNFIYTPRPNVAVYECYLCRNQYNKRNRLREHMNSHISGPYLCVICGAVYKSTDTLRHHMEKHKANPNEPHQCSECGKMYPTRRYMLSHYRTIHLNKRRKKMTTERKYDVVCKMCNKKFLNQHNLKQHMMTHNRDPNELICHICGWEFKERGNLKQHMESHGNNKTTCELCSKVVSIRYMKEHLRIHSGNKEHQCAACGKQFVSRERLKRHMVRHSGEAKFKCDLCPKAYTRSDKLLYHRRTHDQQMNHTCQTCSKGFFSLKSLRKHENKHYLEDNGIAKSENPNI